MKIFFTLLLACIVVAGTAQSSTSRDNSASTPNRLFNIKILKTYPNPATSYITFEFQRSYSTGLSIEIFDLPGKKVTAVPSLQTSTTIQLQNFYRGVYIYKLLDRNKKVLESGKFQVVK